MTPQEQARLAARPVDPDALDAYLQGRFNWHTRDEARVKKSIEWFQTAVARQPDYALAYAGLADAYSVQAGAADGPARHELEEKSCAAASRAVALNDRLGEAHASVAGCADTWNWSEREREFRKAIDLSPGSSTAHQWYGALLTKTGRVAEGVAEERQAVQLDPLAPSSRNQLGWALYMARQYPAAIEQHRGNVGVFPWYTQGYANLGISYAAAGRYADGIEVLEQGVRMAGAAPPLLALRAHVRTLQGDAADARRLVGDWASRGDVTPIAVALLYSDLGDADHAFAWLERGVTERSMFIDELKVEPMFDRLREDPRFPALLRRMHLAN
jgi:tetratricopeptide (TPR) repeat protein